MPVHKCVQTPSKYDENWFITHTIHLECGQKWILYNIQHSYMCTLLVIRTSVDKRVKCKKCESHSHTAHKSFNRSRNWTWKCSVLKIEYAFYFQMELIKSRNSSTSHWPFGGFVCVCGSAMHYRIANTASFESISLNMF